MTTSTKTKRQPKPETISALKERGFSSIKEYLIDLRDEYGLPGFVVAAIWQSLGEDELFDGIVSACQDAENSGEFDDYSSIYA